MCIQNDSDNGIPGSEQQQKSEFSAWQIENRLL